MRSDYFNIKKDGELIAKGTHFWCEICLTAKPLDDQSPVPRRCFSCHESMQGDKNRSNILGDYWIKGSAIFVHYDRQYGITAEGLTAYRLGDNREGAVAIPAKARGVAKLPDREMVGAVEKAVEKEGSYATIKHAGGRPKKEGEVHRVTTWRREKQGTLL